MVLLNAKLYNGSTSIIGSEFHGIVQYYTIIITASVLFVILVFWGLVRLGCFKKSTVVERRKKKMTPPSKMKVKLKKGGEEEQIIERNEPYADELKKARKT